MKAGRQLWRAGTCAALSATLIFSGGELARGQAQTPAPDAALISTLPETTNEFFEPLAINERNAQVYRKIIVPELMPYVRAGSLEMAAARALPFSAALVEARDFQAPARTPGKLDGAGIPELLWQAARESAAPGLQPFGSAVFIDQIADEKERAQKILWNSEALWWRYAWIEGRFLLSVIKESHIDSRLSGSLQRVYMLTRPEGSPSGHYFRELVDFSAPKAVHGLAFLWFRLLGGEEEPLWVRSPAINKVRQLTPANRSDALFGSSLALEDFFVWSGKIELIQLRSIGVRTALMPFASIHKAAPANSNADSACLRFGADSDAEVKSEDALSFDTLFGEADLPTREFSATPFPSLAGSVFVPRQVWRIELNASDPFSSVGRQILYVDRDSMLPLLKIIFNKAGVLIRVVWGLYSFADIPVSEGARIIPVPVVLIASNRDTHISNVLSFERVDLCKEIPKSIKISDFDPVKVEQRYKQ